MHKPQAFQENEIAALHADIEKIAFGTLVTLTGKEIIASHVPMILERRSGSKGVLRGHIAKANGQWRGSDPDSPALAIFNGPGAYISPAWYPSKAEHGKVVPTWNYVAVQAHGSINWTDDPAQLWAIVSGLTDLHEAGRPDPWQVADAPPAFIEAQLKGIIGFEIEIDRLEGVKKLSQNRTAADRTGVERGLAESTDSQAQIIARMMRDLD